MKKDRFKEQFAVATAEAFKIVYQARYKDVGETQVFNPDFIYENLEKPKDASMGRFALPVFKFVQLLGDKPNDIAAKIASETNRVICESGNGPALVESKAVGGFLNARPNFVSAARDTIEKIIVADENYGNSDIGQKRKVLVEYSSPNIAKPFGVGHLRSTVIGNSLRRIFTALGFDAEGINFLGDWGTQFGKMIVAYRKWGNDKTLQGDRVKNLLELYIKFHSEAEKDPALDEQAREAFQKLENGEPEMVELWKEFRDISQAEFDRIYNLLGVEFDWVTSESFLNDKMDAVIERLKKDGLTTVSRGALVVDLKDPQLPPSLLRKADGATLYATRDIAGLIYRWEQKPFHESLYVVGSEQSDHFKQAFKVIELMEEAENLPDSERMTGRVKHIGFGWIRFGDKAMSTRQGNVIILEDVINEAVALVKERIREKNPDLKTIDQTALDVGVGAVIFTQLSVRRQKDVNFDWDEVLSFEGETGPYLQYTHARLCSLMRRYEGEVNTDIDYRLLDREEEQRILELLADFPTVIEDAARDYDPFYISAALLKIAAAFNKFYQRKDGSGKIEKIISDDKKLSAARIALVKAVQIVIAKGLYLLGLKAPKEM